MGDSMFSSVRFIVNEYVQNRKLLFKLACVHMSQSTIRSTWGVVWVYIHDILYFTAFVLFRILMTGSSGGDGMHGVEYLMTGLVPWLLISEVLNSATNAIRLNKVIIQSIKFPITILPGVEVLSIFMKRLPSFLFILVVCIYYGHLANIHILLVLYYILATFAILFSATLLFSAIIAVSDDFHQIYMAFMRVLFFSLPIMWNFRTLEGTQYAIWGRILKLNPLIYIIQGFRDAFVLGNTQPIGYTVYFWGITIVVFWLASFVQGRMQRFYSDFI